MFVECLQQAMASEKLLSQERRKEKGFGKSTNTYLGKVIMGNGSSGAFFVVERCLLNVFGRHVDPNKNLSYSFLQMQQPTPLMKLYRKYLYKFYRLKGWVIHIFRQVRPRNSPISFLKVQLDINGQGSIFSIFLLFFFFYLFYTPYFSLHYLFHVALYTLSGWIPHGVSSHGLSLAFAARIIWKQLLPQSPLRTSWRFTVKNKNYPRPHNYTLSLTYSK